MKTLSHKSFSKDGDNTMKQKHIPVRCFFYLFGMLVLAMGLILNIKAGLGSSAIMSVAYTINISKNLSTENFYLSGCNRAKGEA